MRGRTREYQKHKETARMFVHARVAYFNQVSSFAVGRIAIRNQKTRWGSCSKLGNLNFHYKLVFLPPAVADYVIVHELCHLREFNHSAQFWGLVATILPEYRQLREELARQARILR